MLINCADLVAYLYLIFVCIVYRCYYLILHCLSYIFTLEKVLDMVCHRQSVSINVKFANLASSNMRIYGFYLQSKGDNSDYRWFIKLSLVEFLLSCIFHAALRPAEHCCLVHTNNKNTAIPKQDSQKPRGPHQPWHCKQWYQSIAPPGTHDSDLSLQLVYLSAVDHAAY